jgi:hypothetical protein
MSAWWYWALFAGVVLLIGAFPIAHRWEQRQDERDHKLWDRIWGGR